MKKGFLVPLILCASLSCRANEYFFTPVFSTTERYYSNMFLRPVPLQDNWVSTLSPGLNFGLLHENGELKSNFTWNQIFYTNQSSLNISEQLFSVDYQHNSGRLKWGASNSFNYRSQLNTQGTITGLVFTQVMAKQLTIAPTVSYALTERNSLKFNYSYNNTIYDNNPNPYLTAYTYHQASGTFNHLYTENDKLNLTISSSRYNSQGKDLVPTRTTYNNVAQLGWQHSFSEQLVTYISAGLNYSLSDTSLSYLGSIRGIPYYRNLSTGLLTNEATLKTNGLGKVYQASIEKSFEKGSVSLVGSQNQIPTSQGLQTQTQITVNPAYTINERWTSGLYANYSIYDMTGQQTSSLNRTYVSISPSINWKWTPEIKLDLSYTYRQQDYKGSTQASFDNNVQLQFTYQPQINNQVK